MGLVLQIVLGETWDVSLRRGQDALSVLLGGLS